MEEDKKKKKNKKKKNKQDKQSDEPKANNNGETTVSEQDHVSDSQQNHTAQISKDDGAAQSTRMLESDVKQSGDNSNGISESNLDETEKRIWLQTEAVLEEKIKQLETYKNSCVEKEVDLENKISVLQKENNFLLQKEATMNQQLKDLLTEKTNWTLERASLEDRIKQLENDTELWTVKENTTKETIDRLNRNFIEVQAQVNALEESRERLLQENQELIERVSFLQSQVQHLEEKRSFSASSTTEIEHVQQTTMAEDIDAQIMAGNSLEDKTVTENDEFPEKESIDQMIQLPTINTNIPKDVVSEMREILEAAPTTVDNLEDTRSQESYETDEIVQIPLDETEIREVEVENAEEDKGGVALTEAPLTGAPFRFISFVARYVSGSDLVLTGAEQEMRKRQRPTRSGEA